MPREIVWLPDAAKDVALLRNFIQEKNPNAASRAASRIKEAAQILIENPEAGKPLLKKLCRSGTCFWRPELLPKASIQSEPISQPETTVELILQLFLLGWLNQLIPGAPGESSLTLIFNDQWLALLPWINIVLGAAIIFNAFILLSPYWTRRKIVINALLCASVVIIVGIIISWDSSIAVQVGGDNDYRTYNIPAVWIGLCGFGYQAMIIFQLVLTIRRFW